METQRKSISLTLGIIILMYHFLDMVSPVMSFSRTGHFDWLVFLFIEPD